MPKGEHKRKLTDEQYQEIIQLYQSKHPDGVWVSTGDIARMYNMSPQAIVKRLHLLGVQIRGNSEAHAGKACKPITHIPQGDPPLCKCGCGKLVEWDQHANHWQLYYPGHYRPDAPFKHRAWLEAEYIGKNRTLVELAAECGVAIGTVAYYMRRLGVRMRPQAETLAIRGTSCPGSKNGSWNGGTTPERQHLYKQGHWQELVQSIYARDGFHCRRCGAPKTERKGLHAHHLKRWANHPELRFDPENLVTLCHACHKWVHSLENVNREFLAL